MRVEYVNTAAALITVVIVAITAIAALIQLRHLRASNELNALLKLLELEQSPFLEERFHFVRTQLEEKMKDPDFRSSLDAQPVDRTVHPERHVIAWYENIGSWMKHGLIDEDAYLEIASTYINQFWQLLEPTVAIMRRTRTPWLLEDFEYLAARAKRWLTKHPRGNYPRNTEHLQASNPWQ